MPKESRNVQLDERCTFSSLVSSDDRVYAMHDKSKTTLVCVASYHIRAVLSCDMRTHKHSLIQLAVPHTHEVFLLYITIWGMIRMQLESIRDKAVTKVQSHRHSDHLGDCMRFYQFSKSQRYDMMDWRANAQIPLAVTPYH